jgi:hypothetical protein
VSALGALLLVAAATPSALEEAGESLTAQAKAWNSGDLEGALAAYCDRPDMTWVNRSGITHGYRDFAEGMRKDFADRSKMGVMRILLLHARPLGEGKALMSIRWDISRDGKRAMGGVSTQLWQRCGGKLRVVLEHAS